MKAQILDPLPPDSYGYTNVLFYEPYFWGSFSFSGLVTIADQYGAGQMPAGMEQPFAFFSDLPNPPSTPNYQQPLVSQTGDYQFDANGNLLTTTTPAIERVILILKTRYGSQSTGLGFGLPPILDRNSRQLIVSSVTNSLAALVADGSISNLTVRPSKQGSQVSVRISFVDNADGQTQNHTQTLQH